MIYLLTAAGLVVAAVLTVLLWRLSRAAAEAERLLARVNQMTPRIDRVLAEAEAELVELRRVTQKVDSIVDSAQQISRKAASVAIPVLDGAMALSKPLKYISAALLGVQTFMKIFQKRTDAPEEADEDARLDRERPDEKPEASNGRDQSLDALDEKLPKPQDVEA